MNPFRKTKRYGLILLTAVVFMLACNTLSAASTPASNPLATLAASTPFSADSTAQVVCRERNDERTPGTKSKCRFDEDICSF
ncbi:MAG: hypothetical protein FJZ86_17615 [Chloroflexi bacterium]|nr:hypothetical protein [Chloroflexota bacterium]